MRDIPDLGNVQLPGPGIVDQTSFAYQNLFGYAPDPGITITAEQATTSGTVIDFTIPGWVKEISINFVGVSTDGTSNMLIQLGDAGGVENTNYACASSSIGAAGVATTNFTTGFGFTKAAAANILDGTINLRLQNAANFTWVCEGGVALSDTTTTKVVFGSKATSAVMTTVRITSVTPDNFDAGAISLHLKG